MTLSVNSISSSFDFAAAREEVLDDIHIADRGEIEEGTNAAAEPIRAASKVIFMVVCALVRNFGFASMLMFKEDEVPIT